MDREHFGSRLGFILMAAGCAIGLGNVWRFPYITGHCGGAIFFLIYLCFLLLIGFPVMVAELALGRAAQSDLPGAYSSLNPGSAPRLWRVIGHVSFLGNYLLLMFYSVITGWILSYCWKFCTGAFDAAEAADTATYFGTFLADWPEMLLFNELGILATMAVCMFGVRNGIERAMKVMLGGMFLLEIAIIVLVLLQPGAGEGIRFFLWPDWSRVLKAGIWETVHAAMTQAFFTLSLGIGSMAICGSYIGRERSLTGESVTIIVLDTAAAVAAGLIIFPACFAHGVQPGQGPSLIFITLAKVFRAMPLGRLLGALFFLFLSAAAFSTLLAVAENIVAYLMRMLRTSRRKASLLFGVMLAVLSLPCLFGFNLLADFHPLGGESGVLDLEDFIVSDNLLPLGSCAILIFVMHVWKTGNFLAEVDSGRGMKFPRFMLFYVKWILPVIILCLWGYGIWAKFFRIS